MSAYRRAVAVVVFAIALAIAATGCSSSDEEEATPLKVAVVTDIGGLNDKGFNALAYKGLQEAESEYGVEGRVFISKSAADYVPNLSTAAGRATT